MTKNVIKYLFLSVIVSMILHSCSPTKYIQQGDYIVDKVKIEGVPNDVGTSRMKKIAKPVPLKKIGGVYAFRARIYNLINPAKTSKYDIKRQNKLDKKNTKIKNKILKDNSKILDDRNRKLNKANRLAKNGDTIGSAKAYNQYLQLKNEYDYKSTHLAEIIDNEKKTDVFTIPDFIRKNGQKPQLYDTVLMNYTIKQFEVYLRNQGYFNAKISYKVDTINKKRVKIIYVVDAGKPLIIGTVSYIFPDTADNKNIDDLKNILSNNPSYKLLGGKKIDIDKLEDFRNNLSELYRDNGYYYFSKQLISFEIDTTRNKYHQAGLVVRFSNDVDPKKVYTPWYIHNISVFNDYQPNIALQDPNYFDNVKVDTFVSDEGIPITMFVKNRQIIKPKYIAKQIYLFPDSLYGLAATKTTYSHLSKFKIYKLTNIQFTEVDNDSINYLDCDIRLSPDNKTDVMFDLVATRNNLNFGGGANAVFSHKNLFKGGEIIDFSTEVALEHQKINDTTLVSNFFNTQEYSLNLKLIIPRLLIPFKSNNFIKRNNPKTIILTSFSYQNRPEYNRTQTLLRLDYYLQSSNFISHTITPIRLSSIQAELTPEFRDWVERAMLQESYEPHFIIGSNYSFTYSNQKTKNQSFYLQSNFSLAGNSLYYYMKSVNADTVNGSYVMPLFKTQISQFAKADFDFRYLYIVKSKSGKIDQQLATRFFIGAGVPYGNSKLLPFSEKYFSGGANSIRAWQARTLGPGKFQQTGDYKYINQTADIKLEMNLEYRFNIISILEGAIFLDVGNIWNINSYDTRAGGVFFINQFYKQLAYGTGFGARLNLGFFVFRTDLGIKIVDPAADEGKRFILASRPYQWSDFVINIAIGYPF